MVSQSTRFCGHQSAVAGQLHSRLMAQADIQVLELNDFVLTLVSLILISFILLECLVSLFSS